jgi:Phosphate-selective porin O and P
MRIAISAVVGMTVTLSTVMAVAQSAPSPPPVAPPPPADDRPELVGWRDGFFLRDPQDYVRFYPHLLVETDFYSSFGPGVSGVTAPAVATGLEPRIFVRRARIGFDAELFKRWSVTALLDFGGQPVANSSGTAETSAAAPGVTPTASTGRYAAIESVASTPAPADVFINYSVCRCLNLQIGQFAVPFSLDNRTDDDSYPLLERPVAIRNFVVPSQRDVGAILWGELGPRVFSYEGGVVGGDGQNRPSVDGLVDFVGRVFVRPFAGGGTTDLEKYTQIGASARHGERNPALVGYDAPAITTAQGFVLWSPTYIDSMNRLIHVIPSGAQNEIGGELRLQSGRFSLQGEAYYVVNDTREAVDGYQLTNTERFGRIAGVGWYAQVSAWPLGDAFLTPEPGVSRPRHLDLNARQPTRTPQGLEMIVLVSGINASYRGATRLDSVPDINTPMSDITIYQVGVAANYWYTRHTHFGINYMAYVTPSSGTPTVNQAMVPANLAHANGVPDDGHVLHELSARLAVTF